jgi:uncharacterized protein
MRVKIDKIREGGFRFEAPMPREALETVLADAATDFHAVGEVAVRVDLSDAGDRIVAQGHLETPLTGTCKRCLREVALTAPADFVLGLRQAGGARPHADDPDLEEDPGQGPPAGSFTLEEADEDTYTGDEIDLAPFVREQILLSLPDYVLCDPACKGLCSVCGADLNGGECGCERTVPDPRLAALKDLKLS